MSDIMQLFALNTQLSSPLPLYACIYHFSGRVGPHPPALKTSGSSVDSRPREAAARAPALKTSGSSVDSRPREKAEVNPQPNGDTNALVALAQDFSPRFECHGDDVVAIDVSGLDRLLGDPRAIGEELGRSASARGLRVQVALAATRAAAMVLAYARPGLTVVERGKEADALASLPIDVLRKVAAHLMDHHLFVARGAPPPRAPHASPSSVDSRARVKAAASIFHAWGLKTLGDLAALPAAELAARLGQQGLVWQILARGEDVRPLVPTLSEERFESSIELEWPIEGLEPLSFVLTRLLEPLSTRLERRDRGAAALYVALGLVTGHDTYARHLQLPAPMRDVRTLRTLILLDLESHPPPAAIERVTVLIDPTPGRVLQHTLFTRAHPTPEQLSTLIARLTALMGQDRIGRPALVDSYRPGAFGMQPFAKDIQSSPEGESLRSSPRSSARGGGAPRAIKNDSRPREKAVVSALRRCRHPVPARVAVADGRPVAVTTDRRGFAGGRVLMCAGPWLTSGNWWEQANGLHPRPGVYARCRGTAELGERVGVGPLGQHPSARVYARARGTGMPCERVGVGPHADKSWSRDEWDVSLSDGAVYRIFKDRVTEGWFIDAIVD